LAPLLVLGAGYIGAAVGEVAMSEGEEVVLADNWYATDRSQLAELERRGARVETADVRDDGDLARLLSLEPARVYLLAAQASRPLSFQDPGYTEQTNLIGPRLVAEAVAAAGGPPLVFASSLHVYGGAPAGEIGPDHPFGPQSDLAHLSKVYAEILLRMHAEREGLDLAILRLGIVYGPSPVEHADPGSQTVVDRFRRLAAAGKPLPLDDGGRATVGVVHIEDAARILLRAPYSQGITVANVAAESATVAQVAALVEGRQPPDGATATFATPFEYRHRLVDYLEGSAGTERSRRRGPRATGAR
jgi:nucleoside-diphosphate-sugar epimerase